MIRTPSPLPARRRWSRRLGALAVGLALALGMAEVGLRARGFEFRLYPEKLEFGFPEPRQIGRYFVAHDRYLWAQSDYDERLAAARELQPQVVLMGCSCTEWGKYDEGLVAAHAELPGEPELRVTNLGVSGWSSFQGLLQLEHDVVPLAPDVVTIFYGWNDHWIGFGIEDKDAATFSSSALNRLQRSRVVQLVTQKVVAARAEGERSLGAGGRPERVSLVDFRANLEAMVALARENGIAPVLITAPTTAEVGDEPPHLAQRHLNDLSELVPLHDAYVAVVREVAEELDVALCDLVARFAELPREEVERYIKDDAIHFTPEGGAKVGELLHATLVEHDLVDVPAGGGGSE